GSLGYVSEVGIEFTQSGTLQFDGAAFDAALKRDPDAVKTLFAGNGAGAFASIDSLVLQYTQSTGVLSSVRQHLTDSISRLGSQIDAMSNRLAAQRAALQAEFIAADAAMSRLKSQSGAL